MTHIWHPHKYKFRMDFGEMAMKEYIGITLQYFKMDVMPLVPETKMVDVCILISLGNLLARRTTWLVLKNTSATSNFSRGFGAYSMTRIFYKYYNLPTLTPFFTISLTESTHSFHCDFQREHSHSSISNHRFNTALFHNFTWSVNTALFHIFTYRINTLFPVRLPERTRSLSPFQLTESTHSSFFLHLTHSSQPPQKWLLSATILFLVILFR